MSNDCDHKEYGRYVLFLRWAEHDDREAYEQLYALLRPIAEGMYVRRLFATTPLEDRQQEGCYRLAYTLDLAKRKHLKEPFNSLKGLSCYIMLCLKDKIFTYIDDTDPTLIDNSVTLAETNNTDFWLDYNRLYVELTNRQKKVLSLLAENRTVGEVADMMLINRDTALNESKEIAKKMAPLALYYKSEQAERFASFAEIDDDEPGAEVD